VRVSRNLHIVFSQRPDHISDEEFNAWYDPHLDEILVVPGFVSAQRYRLEPMVRKPGTSVPYGFLSLYELEGDVPTIMADLDAEAASGTMDLPRWFPEIKFASWNCYPLGDRVEQRR
jgi:hypothetical protein